MNSAMSAGYSDTRTGRESWADVGRVPRPHARAEGIHPGHDWD